MQSQDHFMHQICCPLGQEIQIPSTAQEDRPYFGIQESESAKRYYEDNGYVVIRGLIPADICDRVITAFEDDVATYNGFIYRQDTGNPERHEFNEQRFVTNPILNIQDLPTIVFSNYKESALEVLTADTVQAVASVLLDDRPKLVQSMYFHGNPATWAHQDTYYLDSERLGVMTAGWFALEDIGPGAGRFYVYPGSHRIGVDQHAGDLDIAFHHDRYQSLIKSLILESGLECRAPAVAKGDVLFWNSKTIHGSLVTNTPERSRNSLTAHYIPHSDRFLQFQSRIRPLRLKYRNGMAVHCPKDLDRLRNRLILMIETRFPHAFQLAKKLAIKLVTN